MAAARAAPTANFDVAGCAAVNQCDIFELRRTAADTAVRRTDRAKLLPFGHSKMGARRDDGLPSTCITIFGRGPGWLRSGFVCRLRWWPGRRGAGARKRERKFSKRPVRLVMERTEEARRKRSRDSSGRGRFRISQRATRLAPNPTLPGKT